MWRASGGTAFPEGRFRAMTLTYHLDGAGWATATIANEGEHRDMTASYLSDSLLEMTQAAICLLEGADAVRFSFDDEPGEHRCIITRVSDADARIRVLWFDGLWSGLPDERGSEVFTCTTTTARFCGEVLSCLQRLLADHGLEGYKTLWVSHDFPSEKYERLRTLIYEHRKEKSSA